MALAEFGETGKLNLGPISFLIVGGFIVSPFRTSFDMLLVSNCTERELSAGPVLNIARLILDECLEMGFSI